MDSGIVTMDLPNSAVDMQGQQQGVYAAIESELIERRQEFIRFLMKRLGDRVAAEDVFQQSCLRIYSSDAPLRDVDRAVPWLYTVLRTTLIDHYRHESTRGRKEREFWLMQSLEEEARLFSGNEEIGICGCMARLIDGMRRDYAEILRRVDLAGQMPNEAAAELGLTGNNLRVRLHRARNALKCALLKNCGPCAENGCRQCVCEGRPTGNSRN